MQSNQKLKIATTPNTDIKNIHELGSQNLEGNPDIYLLEELYEPSCYRDTAQDSLEKVGMYFIARHQKLWKMMQNRKANRISRWVNANTTNWHFAKWVNASYLTKEPFTVTYIADEMNVTRTTARKLIADCLGEGWVRQVATNDKRTISYIGEKPFYQQWERYLSYMIKYSEFDDFYKSLKTYEFCIDKLEMIEKGSTENMDSP